MYTITTKVSDDVNVRLENLATLTERKKSYFVRKAIEEFLNEKEDYLIALYRLEQKGERISLEQLERECELED